MAKDDDTSADTPVTPDAPAPTQAAAGVAASPETPIMTAEEYREVVAKEYGEYIATEDITVNGVPAFRKGDPVPKSHVDGGTVSKESVARTTTKAAGAVIDELNA